MDTSKPMIFVSIASYCDPELPRTLDDCIANARYPENLRFGICWQYDTREPIDLSRFKADRRFRFSEHPCQDSEGGCWARSLAQEFWDGETYCMQVDSHMVFAPGWDASLIHMMRTLPAGRPLITMISPLFRMDEDGGIHKQRNQGVRTTKMVDWKQDAGWAPWFDWGLTAKSAACRNRFVSGGFVFTLGVWTEQVCQDPDHYYWGEEFALSLRSYTHGYDFFVPDDIVAWHMEHRNAAPRRHWEHGTQVIANKNRIAFERLRKLAYSDDPADSRALGRFGLGNRRSRADYERFAGIDLVNKRAHPDVFSGRSPDPETIRTKEDWAHCISFEDQNSQQPA